MTARHQPRLRTLAIVQAITFVIPLGAHVAASAAFASAALAVTLTGGTGTALVGGTQFAKSGAALTVTVVTDTTMQCVQLSGANSGSLTVPASSDATSKTWQFAITAAAGADGPTTLNVTASVDPRCATSDDSAISTYTIDNTAPTLTGTLSPTPNLFAWSNTDVTVNWTATDAGSGVASGPTPATQTQTVETGGLIKMSTATDNVGNGRTSQVVVKLDKTAPSISGVLAPAANANGWNNTDVTVRFTCTDGRSGIRSCTAQSTFTANVTGQMVNGTALDFASNTTSTNVTVNIDKNAPTISGAPVGTPNAAGWFNTDVVVDWSCSDTGGSGFAASACAGSSITSEGTGQTASKSVSDLAGNSSSAATSAPAVNIDKTPPVTSATAVPTWSNSDVSVMLSGTDGLSGMASTSYMIDGDGAQAYTGAPVVVGSEGAHTLEFWSTDIAGNTETHKVLFVNVDKSGPAVVVSQLPAANANGWNNSDVIVHFDCSDSFSGVASCPADSTISTEGAGQVVSATATDNAGNTSGASTSASIDKTAPTVSGTASPDANSFGWNNTDVVVTYSCSDALSGVVSCQAAQTLSAEAAGQSVSGSAIDAADNSSSTTIGGINIDKTAPVVAVDGVVGGGTYDVGDYTASCVSSDALSGVASAAVLSTSGGPTGPVTLTCSGAADRAGNAQAVPVSVTINVRAATATYQFGGFQRPLVDSDSVNVAKAGSAVPVKFSLGGFRGMDIFESGFPASAMCDTEASVPTVAALSYDVASDTYSFVWKTDKAWTGCRVLQLDFADGSSARALFDFGDPSPASAPGKRR